MTGDGQKRSDVAASHNGAVTGDATSNHDPKRRLDVGVALESQRITAVEVVRGRLRSTRGKVLTRTIDPLESENAEGALREVFGELKDHMPARDVALSVALARSHAWTKVLPLPPLERDALRTMVERNARRFMPLEDAPVVADAVPLERPVGGTISTLAAAGPAWLVDAICQAVDSAGMRLRVIVPSPVAVQAALGVWLRSHRRQTCAIASLGDDTTEILWLERRRLQRLRTLAVRRRGVHAGSSDDAAAQSAVEDGAGGVAGTCTPVHGMDGRTVDLLCRVLADDPTSPTRVAVVGTGELPGVVTAGIGENMEGPGPEVGGVTPVGLHDPASVQAYGSTRVRQDDLTLIPAQRRAAIRRRERKLIAVVTAASVLLALLGTALHLVDVRRELAATRSRRASIGPAVAHASRYRVALDSARSRLVALRAIVDSAEVWMPAFAELARVLPESTFIETLETTGSRTVEVHGATRSPTEALRAIQGSPLFQTVELLRAGEQSADRPRHQELAVSFSISIDDAEGHADMLRDGSTASGEAPAADPARAAPVQAGARTDRGSP